MARIRTGDEMRQRRAHPHVQIPRGTIRDKRMSLRARGLLGLLLDQSDEWVFSMKWLGDQVETQGKEGEGREAIATALRELRRLGYYRVERRHMLIDGTFRSGGYVSDTAVPEWAASFAAASASCATKTPRWDCTVRVRPDGTVEDDEPASDTPPISTDGEDLDSDGDGVPDPRKSVIGPIPGNPVTGSPGDRRTGDLKNNITEEHQEEGYLGGDTYVSRGDQDQPPTPISSSPAPAAPGAAEDPEPARTCGTGHLPALACRACGDARRAYGEWEGRQSARRRAAEVAAHRAARQQSRLAVAEQEACRLCDAEGTAVVELSEGAVTLACMHDAVANRLSVNARRSFRSVADLKERYGRKETGSSQAS
jgi:hypothetical protein